jgi:hypothetical protein
VLNYLSTGKTLPYLTVLIPETSERQTEEWKLTNLLCGSVLQTLLAASA